MLHQIKQWIESAEIRRGIAPAVDAENFAYAFPRFYFEEAELRRNYLLRFDQNELLAAGEASARLLSEAKAANEEVGALLTVAKAGFVSGQPQFFEAAYRYVSQRMAANPPYRSEQWRKPAQVAVRLMGLIWSFSLLRQDKAFDAEAQRKTQEWIYRHAQCLQAWRGKLRCDVDQIACASALTVAGIQFPLFDQAEEWENSAWAILLERVEASLPQMARKNEWARIICVLEFSTLAYAVAKMKRLALPVTFIAHIEEALQVILKNRKEAETQLASSSLPHLPLNGKEHQLRALANSVGLMRQNRELLQQGQGLEEWTFWAAGERAIQAFDQ